MKQSEEQAAGLETNGEALSGKYLTFRLGDDEYGIGILKVQEIIGIMTVTHVPRTPDYVRGVINLRGKVIPVVDIRIKFGMAEKEYDERTCIIVVQMERRGERVTTGILVDEVSEVLNIAGSLIEPPPSFGADIDTEFILGMGKVEGNVYILLDIDKVLSEEAFGVISRLPEDQQ